MECLWSQAQVNITGWNPTPKYNSGQIQSDGKVLVILVSHVTSAGRCDNVRDVTAEAEVDAGDSVGHWWMILHIQSQGQGQQGWDGRRSTNHQWGWGGMLK